MRSRGIWRGLNPCAGTGHELLDGAYTGAMLAAAGILVFVAWEVLA